MSGRVTYRLEKSVEGTDNSGSVSILSAGSVVEASGGFQTDDGLFLNVNLDGIHALCDFEHLEPIVPEGM